APVLVAQELVLITYVGDPLAVRETLGSLSGPLRCVSVRTASVSSATVCTSVLAVSSSHSGVRLALKTTALPSASQARLPRMLCAPNVNWIGAPPSVEIQNTCV